MSPRIAVAYCQFWLVLVISVFWPVSGFSETSMAPNVILILVDDLGWPQTGPYGSSFYETPALEVLAQEGMTFHNAYSAAAVCSPTRAAMQTGKHPARLHLTDFIPGEDTNDRPLQEPDWQKYLPLSEYTLGELFEDAGYATAYFGKWHLSPGKKLPKSLLHNPWNQGYGDSFITFKPSRSLAQEWQTPENDGHNVKILTKRALDFMSHNRDTPFFLTISHNSIHRPLMEREQHIKKFAQKEGVDLPKNKAVLAAMIETVDDSVGQILEHLKYLGLSKNTIVIFYSDNGGDAGNKQLQAPLRGGKGWLYEGGIRVPLIVRWPVVVEKSSHSNALVTSTDFFPTFMEILGENDRKHSDSLDGESMLDLFRGLSKQSERTLFWHYPHYHGSGMKPAGASRKGKYKLIEWYGTSSCGDNAQIELYDLSTDIGETRNLAETLPDKTRELLRQMEGWRRDIGAQMPEDNPDFPSDEKCGT